jgi:hypothetical protein
LPPIFVCATPRERPLVPVAIHLASSSEKPIHLAGSRVVCLLTYAVNGQQTPRILGVQAFTP